MRAGWVNRRCKHRRPFWLRWVKSRSDWCCEDRSPDRANVRRFDRRLPSQSTRRSSRGRIDRPHPNAWERLCRCWQLRFTFQLSDYVDEAPNPFALKMSIVDDSLELSCDPYWGINDCAHQKFSDLSSCWWTLNAFAIKMSIAFDNIADNWIIWERRGWSPNRSHCEREIHPAWVRDDVNHD